MTDIIMSKDEERIKTMFENAMQLALSKGREYGHMYFNPKGFLTNGDPIQRLKFRADEKIERIIKASADGKEPSPDTYLDLAIIMLYLYELTKKEE